MTSMKLTITADEVNSPHVDAKLRERDMVLRTSEHYEQAQLPQATARRQPFAFLYNAAVYMGLFGLLGGLLGWTVGEVMHFRPDPQAEARELIEAERQIREAVAAERLSESAATLALKELARTGRDNVYYATHLDATLDAPARRARLAALAAQDDLKHFLANVLFYGASGVMIAVCLGAAEPVVERNWRAATLYGSAGAVAGLAGGVVVALFAERLYALLAGAGDAPFARQMAARAATWGTLGLFLSAAAGAVLRNPKKLLIGMAGGLVGGVAGGLLFDPVVRLTGGNHHLSRLVAVVAIGVVSGVATGLIEDAVKAGWFKVTGGLIAGKQFVLYRNPTYIGSSPQSHIYLFKDPQVGRRHAAVHVVPGGYEIEDLPLGGKTLVNGKAVSRARLRSGDRIQVGRTTFQFSEKAKK